MTTPAVTVARTARDLVVVEGDDAATYLQGQLSQDVAGMAVGESAPSFVLAPQGKVDGWGRVHRTAADRFEVDVDAGAGEAWAARLSRFLLRTKATVAVIPNVACIEVRGTSVDGGLPPLGVGVTGADFVGWDAPGPPPGTPEGAEVIDSDAVDAARIRAGVPVWGAELDGDTIPATIGQWAIDASVSFTKGCYTGQELVARIDSRGGNVPRHLCRLDIEGQPPESGTEVTVDGTVVGTITSSATDTDAGRAVALAYIARSVDLTPEGTPATVASSPAVIRALPLV